MGRVDGKVALITGAARGQGRSHALRLAQEGADVIAVDLCDTIPDAVYPSATEEDLAETVRQVEALDHRIIAHKADIRNTSALKAAIEDGVSQLGRLDIVVANAGICIMSPWDEQTTEIWDNTISTNLTGTWNTVRFAAPHLIASGGGSIILTSSAAGIKGVPWSIAYNASKFGVVGLMRSFATELAEYNIRVNSLHPTGVETPMTKGDLRESLESWMNAHPRLGAMYTNLLPVEMTQPIDQSNAVLFLASDESRYVTALEMTVDAGTTRY